MSRPASAASMGSANSEYVAVYSVPAHAPRSRSGSHSHTSGGEIYEEDDHDGDDATDIQTSFRSQDSNHEEEDEPTNVFYRRQSSTTSTDSIQLRGRHRSSQFNGAIRRESRLVHSGSNVNNKNKPKKDLLRESVNRVMMMNRMASLIHEVDRDDDGNDESDHDDNNNNTNTNDDNDKKAESKGTTTAQGLHEKEINELQNRVAPEKEVLELWREVAEEMDTGKSLSFMFLILYTIYFL